MLKRRKVVSMLLFLTSFSFGTVYATNAYDATNAEVMQQADKCIGHVRDAAGEPVIGASVMVKGTNNGTISNMDGDFTLMNVSKGSTILISFVGYKPVEIKWTGQPINVILEDDSQALDEIVVTALGIKKDSKKLGYAVSTVSADDLVRTASPNLGTALYGKASGVRIQTAPGGATGSISINVRGLSSITGTNQPLIVVDGVPIHNGDANNTDYWGSQRINSNGLADINPEDIETLSILKGASASALYGSEAANGVVMITTKSGKGVKGVGVEFNANWTSDRVAYMPKYQTTYGPGTVVESRASSGSDVDGWYYRNDRNGNRQKTFYPTTTHYGPAYDGSDVLYYDGTMRSYNAITSDPWSDVFRSGFNQQYNLAITKGCDAGNIRISYTFVDNIPTQYNSSFNKHNFNITGSYNVIDNIKVDFTANYILQDIKNRPYRISRITNNFGGMFSAFDDVNYLRNNTMTSLGYMNQSWAASNHATPSEGFEWNPSCSALVSEYYWNIYGKEQHENNNRLIASITPSWEIIDGLVLRARAATDFTSGKIENKNKTEQSTAFGSYSGYYGNTNERYEIYYGDVMLSYSKDFKNKLGLVAAVGWQGRKERANTTSVGTNGGLSVENWFHLNASRSAVSGGMYVSEFLKTAYFGTLNLSYDNWIFLEGTGRQEKISTLAKNNNSFFYPSVNTSFIFTELLKNSMPSWYQYGKVRLSYGIVGNAPEIYKATQASQQGSASGYNYNTVSTTVGNETIKPEKKYEWAFGLESRFLNNRLGFELSFYKNKVKDQILNTTMPSSSGGKSILMNIGELKNKGLEISAFGTPIQTKDWRWEVRANMAWNRNKVTKLAEGIDVLQHSNWDNGSTYLYSKVGEPMGDIYSYAPAKDENGNNIITADGFYKLTDEPVKVGNAMPKFVGGFSTSLRYKNFLLDASLDFRVGGAVLNLPYQYLMGRGTLEDSMPYRDAAHGGLSYYLANGVVTPHSGTTGPNGEKIYNNGLILQGVKQDGTPNDKMIAADKYYWWTYNWGGYDPSSETYYSHSIFDNTYVKVREISISYIFPETILSKFGCNNLVVSAFTRNPFYIYKKMPGFDAEATDGTSWISQACIGGSTATTRSFGLSLRVGF